MQEFQNTHGQVPVSGSTRTLPAEYRVPSWKDALDAFILNLDAKDQTKNQYRKALKIIFTWAENHGLQLSSLKRADILAFRKDLLEGEKKRTTRTVSAYIVAVRRFYQWAESEKLYPNIAFGIPRKSFSAALMRNCVSNAPPKH